MCIWESEAEAPPSGRGPSPGCPPQPPARQHGQSPATHMDSLQTHGTKLQVS